MAGSSVPPKGSKCVTDTSHVALSGKERKEELRCPPVERARSRWTTPLSFRCLFGSREGRGYIALGLARRLLQTPSARASIRRIFLI